MNDPTLELDYLRFLVYEGWQKKLAPKFRSAEAAGNGRAIFSEIRDEQGEDPWVPEKIYADRLCHEIPLLHRKGYIPYFLIVENTYKFIHAQQIPRGDARGSITACLVAYLLNITLVDPVRHDLYFGRFLNEARYDSVDVDMDVSISRRAEVKDYWRQKYGSDRVAEIATFMKFGGKNSVQHVARVFGVSLLETTDATKHMVDRAKGDARAYNTVEDSVDLPGFQEYAESYPEVIVHAAKLEGQWSGLGKHAAGTVISNRPLAEFAPIIRQNSEYRLGVDMAACSDLGLLKLDLLGSRPPETMAATFQQMRDRHEPATCGCPGCVEIKKLGMTADFVAGKFLDFYDQIPIEDLQVLAMIADGRTYGLMQLETPGMTKLMRRMGPSRFSQIADANAIHRPGALRSGATEHYVRRLRGDEKLPTTDAIYDQITGTSQGCVIFQEQIQRLACEFAGYSEADTEGLRRLVQKSMGQEVIAKQESQFVEGAMALGHDEKTAQWVFSQIVTAGEYSFNQAHAVGYSYTSVRQGWFKRYFPAEFLCACLNSTRAADKISGFIRESEKLGIPVFRPHVNRSGVHFEIRTVQGQTAIQAGFAILRNVGEVPAQALVEASALHGPFRDYAHFLESTSRHTVGKRVVEALAGSGALEPLIPNCKRLLQGLDLLWDNKTKRDAGLREEWLVSCRDGSAPGWTEDERTLSQAHWLMMPPERSLLLCYSGVMQRLDPRHTFLSVSAMEASEEYPSALVQVLITSVKESFREKDSSGDEEDEEENPYLGWAALIIEDASDFVLATCDPETWERLRPVLEKAEGKAAILRVQKRPGSDRVNVVEATLLDPLVAKLKQQDAGEAVTLSPFELYLLENPLKRYAAVREAFQIEDLGEINRQVKKLGAEKVRVWGSIISRRPLKTRKDQREFMMITLEEGGHQAEVMVWPDQFARFRETLLSENLVALKVKAMAPNQHSRQWKLEVPRDGGILSLPELAAQMEKKSHVIVG